MDSQSSYSHTDAVKSISNILREPSPLSRGESRETAAEILSEPTPVPASQSTGEFSEMLAQSSTFPAHHAAKLPNPSSGRRHLRAALWRFLVLCVEPIFSRLRNYLVGPLQTKIEVHAAETRADTELNQLQLKVIRADLEFLPKQLAQVEFRSRNFAKQLAQLESQLGILADRLARLEPYAGSVHGRIELLEGMNQVLASHREIVLIVEYGVPELQRIGISPVEWFGRFFAHGLTLFAFDEQAGGWRQIEEEQAVNLPSTTVAFVRPGTNQWTILKQHEL